jgi:iron complex outermembrane receptor protein
MNGTLSVYATKDLVFYAGYTKGLEESPVAPEVARNKDEAPPAIITEQMDAGLRYAITDNLRLVAGVFDVKKPYYALDSDLIFSNLGTVRHRGVELSLAGRIAPGLNVVAGTVFLDATLSGEAVDEGLVGRRPINATGRTSSAAVEYQVPWIEGLSVDLFYESTSKRAANRQNTLFVPPRYIVSPGFRYRFRLGDNPATLRAQLATANNAYGYNVIGEGVYYNVPRRFSLTLVTDL